MQNVYHFLRDLTEIFPQIGAWKSHKDACRSSRALISIAWNTQQVLSGSGEEDKARRAKELVSSFFGVAEEELQHPVDVFIGAIGAMHKGAGHWDDDAVKAIYSQMITAWDGGGEDEDGGFLVLNEKVVDLVRKELEHIHLDGSVPESLLYQASQSYVEDARCFDQLLDLDQLLALAKIISGPPDILHQ